MYKKWKKTFFKSSNENVTRWIGQMETKERKIWGRNRDIIEMSNMSESGEASGGASGDALDDNEKNEELEGEERLGAVGGAKINVENIGDQLTVVELHDQPSGLTQQTPVKFRKRPTRKNTNDNPDEDDTIQIVPSYRKPTKEERRLGFSEKYVFDDGNHQAWLVRRRQEDLKQREERQKDDELFCSIN